MGTCDATESYAEIATLTIPSGSNAATYVDPSLPNGQYCYRVGAPNPVTGTTAFGAEGKPPMTIDGHDLRNVMHSLFTFPFNISGHPSFSLPCGLDSDGLPIGLQITGRRHEDHVLFQLAAVFEQIRPWPKIAPAYS